MMMTMIRKPKHPQQTIKKEKKEYKEHNGRTHIQEDK
jgi:hypothetical protein